jgi:hypothetical protein
MLTYVPVWIHVLNGICVNIFTFCVSILLQSKPTVTVQDNDENYLFTDYNEKEKEKGITLKQLTNSLPSNANLTSELGNYQKKLLEKFQCILEKASTVDKCNVIEKALLPMESILAAMDSEPQNFVPPCSEEEITKRKIEPQRKFFSTKKKSRTKTNETPKINKNNLAFSLLHQDDII